MDATRSPDLDTARSALDYMLTGHTAQTVFFADRPERRVGTVPPREFLGRLGFAPTAPLTAAAEARTAAGDEGAFVAELFDVQSRRRRRRGGGMTVAYAARVLAAEPGEQLARLAGRQGGAVLPAAFGAGALFNDSSFDIWCILDPRSHC